MLEFAGINIPISPIIGPAPPTYKCPKCEATFSSLFELTKHMATHVIAPPPPPTYKCSYCGATFSTATKLADHIRTVHLKPCLC